MLDVAPSCNILFFTFLSRYWDNGTGNFPPPKSNGSTVMTSDFFTEEGGNLAYDDATWEIEKRKPEIAEALAKDPTKEWVLRRAGSVLNVSVDGYYNQIRFLADVEKALTIFKAIYGGEFKMLLMLDHSPIHGAMAEDELNPRRMNVRPGGKQPIMRAGWYRNEDGEKVIKEKCIRRHY